MQPTISGLICASVLALTTSSAWAQFKGGKGDPGARFGWLSSLSAGQAEAKRTGKPLFVALRCVP